MRACKRFQGVRVCVRDQADVARDAARLQAGRRVPLRVLATETLAHRQRSAALCHFLLLGSLRDNTHTQANISWAAGEVHGPQIIVSLGQTHSLCTRLSGVSRLQGVF
jgi:hypothetical protein